MATLNLEAVHKAYGAHPVIHSISIDIEDGEFVTLVGPSGCGKSTLLRMIAGLEGITTGRIQIGGRIVNNVAPRDRDIAMVFQSYALYPHKNVEENMGYALKLAGRPKEEIAARVREAAELLALTPLLARKPAQLSGGQRQRVAMGRAIVRDPKVFLFDEPLSNLDAKLRVQMRTQIKELHQRLKTTTVYVTHDQIEAMTMADRIVVMRDGCVEQIGTPLELYDRPLNTFVATFLGSPSMNLIKGWLEAEGFVTEDGTTIALPPSSFPAVKYGHPVTLGVRPEDLFLSGNLGNATINALLTGVEPTGAETMLVSRVGGQSIVALVRDRYMSELGGSITLSFDISKLHFFDADNGLRLP
ncbi:ABC transporter ATP-binding protein [Agrobacterium sp. 22-221-1]